MLIFVVLAVLLLVVDQATKWLVIQHIAYRTGEIDIIPGFFSLVHARNSGAAFGILSGYEHRMLVFAAFTVIAVGVLGQMAWQLPDEDRYQTVALAMIASGAVGNAIDRVRFQYVTDFLRVYVDTPSVKTWMIDNLGTNEWPSFNVADSCIVVGLILFFIYYLFLQKDEAVAPSPAEAPVEDLPSPR